MTFDQWFPIGQGVIIVCTLYGMWRQRVLLRRIETLEWQLETLQEHMRKENLIPEVLPNKVVTRKPQTDYIQITARY